MWQFHTARGVTPLKLKSPTKTTLVCIPGVI